MLSGVAERPSTAYAALPGSTAVAKKTTTEAANSVTSPMPVRLAVRVMSGCSDHQEDACVAWSGVAGARTCVAVASSSLRWSGPSGP